MWRLSRIFGFAAALIAGAIAGAQPAHAETQVDLQLVLAVDVSGSVNQTRFELQRQGYAAAFRHPRVLRAIRSGSTAAAPASPIETGVAPNT